MPGYSGTFMQFTRTLQIGCAFLVIYRRKFTAPILAAIFTAYCVYVPLIK